MISHIFNHSSTFLCMTCSTLRSWTKMTKKKCHLHSACTAYLYDVCGYDYNLDSYNFIPRLYIHHLISLALCAYIHCICWFNKKTQGHLEEKK